MLLDLFGHLCAARLVEPGLGRTRLRGWVRSSSFRYGQVSRDNWLSHEDNDKLTVGRSALLRGIDKVKSFLFFQCLALTVARSSGGAKKILSVGQIEIFL